jgi:multidrug resistance protein
MENRKVILGYLAGVLIGAINNGVVIVGFSSFLEEFGVSSSWGIWSLTIYSLFYAITIPISGKLSDQLGRKKVFIWGAIILSIGSFLSVATSSFLLFLIGRTIQAIGAASINPSAGAQVVTMYPPEKRGYALGLMSRVQAAGFILGPMIGGLIVQFFHWKWMFFINIPICLFIILLVLKQQETLNKTKSLLDFKGAFWLSIINLCMMYGLTVERWQVVLLGILLIPVLLKVEMKQNDPILNPDYIRDPRILITLLTSFLVGAAITGMNFGALFSEEILHISKGISGYFLIPAVVFAILATILGGKLVDRIGPKYTLQIGVIICGISYFGTALVTSSVLSLICCSIGVGIGIGMVSGAPLKALMIQLTSSRGIGSALSMVSLFKSIGTTFAGSVAGYILQMNPVNGYHIIYYFFSILCGVSLMMSFTLKAKVKATNENLGISS